MSAEAHEIVIIRHRGHDDHDEHHGGVWKVAFADFMTAMMAFFLVLWLINASNKETRVAVASYFNPIKLVDSSPLKKGLRDGNDSVSGGDSATPSPDSGKLSPGGGVARPPAGKTPEVPKSTEPPGKEAEWLDDPMRMIETVAQGENPAPPPGGGEFRDPFRQPLGAPGATPPSASPQAQPALPPPPPAATAPAATPPAPPAGVEFVAASATPRPPVDADARREAEAVARELTEEIATQLDAGKSARGGPRIEVEAAAEGLLISLTDQAGFSMFRIGSAEPTPDLVKVIGVVAGVLKARMGRIVVRGHTDGRPYRSRYYDNWQLSGARAHLARYMLLRGGLDIARIARVEAHADRALRNAADPEAPENRRIEILLARDP